METIADANSEGKIEFWSLIQKIRLRLAPQITARFLGEDHTVKVFSIEPVLQARIVDKAVNHGAEAQIEFSPPMLTGLVEAIRRGAENLQTAGHAPVIFVSQAIRPAISLLARKNEIDVSVLAAGEIMDSLIESVGEISTESLEQTSVAA